MKRQRRRMELMVKLIQAPHTDRLLLIYKNRQRTLNITCGLEKLQLAATATYLHALTRTHTRF